MLIYQQLWARGPEPDLVELVIIRALQHALLSPDVFSRTLQPSSYPRANAPQAQSGAFKGLEPGEAHHCSLRHSGVPVSLGLGHEQISTLLLGIKCEQTCWHWPE